MSSRFQDWSSKHCQLGKIWGYMSFPINCWGLQWLPWSFSFLWNIDTACRMWCDCSGGDLGRKNLCSASFSVEVQFDMLGDSFALIFAICFELNSQIIKNTGKNSCKLLLNILHLQFEDTGWLWVAYFRLVFVGWCSCNVPVLTLLIINSQPKPSRVQVMCHQLSYVTLILNQNHCF